MASLKIGGPKMTVHEVEGTNINVVWFHDSVQKYAVFNAETLKVYVSAAGTLRVAGP